METAGISWSNYSAFGGSVHEDLQPKKVPESKMIPSRCSIRSGDRRGRSLGEFELQLLSTEKLVLHMSQCEFAGGVFRKLDEYESFADTSMSIPDNCDAENVTELHEEQFNLVLVDSRVDVGDE